MDATTAPSAPAPLTAHLTSTSAPPSATAGHHVDHDSINLGREKVHWGPEVWKRIDEAVAHEAHRASVAPKILPHYKVHHHITNIEADMVLQNLTPGAGPYAPPRAGAGAPATPPLLNVAEAAQLPIIELSVTFALSQAQMKKESEQKGGSPAHHSTPESHEGHPAHGGHPGHGGHPHHKHHPSSTAVMLARRAANILCLARDAVVFLGANALPAAGGGGLPLFVSQTVTARGAPTDNGITCIGGASNLPGAQVLPVTPINTPAGGGANVLAQYSGNTVAAISTACALLVSNGYMGPLASVLYFFEYADSFSPLSNTLVIPADRIKPLLDAGYFTSGMLPGIPNPQTGNAAVQLPGLNGLVNPNTQGIGLVMSLGGNTIEFVNGLDPVTAFAYLDPVGNYIFRVFTRFATKISDLGAIVRLEFA